MPYSVIVDWCGPYRSVAEAKAAIRQNGLGEVLYAAVGSIRRQKVRRIQYVGVTHDFEERLNTAHTIRRYVREEGLRLYIGIVGSQGIAGRRASHQATRHSVSVDLAESAMAFFLELPLNVAKRCRPPRDGMVLVNRWWSADLERRVRRRPHPDWPDLIDYDVYTGEAVVMGAGRRAKYLDADQIGEVGARASREIATRRARAARALAARGRRAGDRLA